MSPAITLTRKKYREAGLEDWDTNRVVTICRMIKCTPRELFAAIGVYNRDMINRLWKGKKWPVYITLHLHKIEQIIVRMKFKEEAGLGVSPDTFTLASLISRHSD